MKTKSRKLSTKQQHRPGLAISERSVLLPRRLWNLIDEEAERPGRRYELTEDEEEHGGYYDNEKGKYALDPDKTDTASDVITRALEAYLG